MHFLKKRILIISPERWGINRLSKHHYALVLAERGNTVFFLNPPTPGLRKIIASKDESGIVILDYSVTFRGVNRLQIFSTQLANFFNKLEVKRILNTIGPIDLIWSFDSFRFQDLTLFNPAFKIFHPVDIIPGYTNLQSAKTADIVLSVSHLILNQFKTILTPSYFINHGLSHHFINSETPSDWKPCGPIKCGYVGNLLSFALHDENLYRIVNDNPTVEFHFIGPVRSSNLGSYTPKHLIEKLKILPNTIFYGEKTPAEIARTITGFDLFLICYHPEKVGRDLSSNSHKILEYLSTGKVVVSNYISTYASVAGELVEMVEHSSELPACFKQTISNLEQLNTAERQQMRKEFAHQNSYANHIQKIEKIISDLP